MTDSPEVLYDVADHIATITLNRPERMNTISRRTRMPTGGWLS
jgi:enoyl-CoA hydratase/carnithine racemase